MPAMLKILLRTYIKLLFKGDCKMKKLIAASILIFTSVAALAQIDILAALDVDQDGRISVQEATADKEISEAFSALDVDQDGYLTADELEG